MLEFIKKYWLFLIIAILVMLLFLSRCGGKNSNIAKSDTSYKHFVKIDTTHKDSLITLIQYTVKNIESLKASKQRLDSFSLASTNYDSLLTQYNSLKEEHLSYNKSVDTISLPNKGYIALEDVVSGNKIISRKPTIDYKSDVITVHDSTITVINNTLAPNRQVYVGGELTGNKENPVNGINGILMYKDRHDRAFLAKAGFLNYNNRAVPQFGIGMLWKLHK